jgi:hypothetical protein
MDRPPGYFSWSGVDCPVPLTAFEYVSLPPSVPGSSEFLVRNFPALESPRFIGNPTGHSTASQTLEVGDDGVIYVPFHAHQ